MSNKYDSYKKSGVEWIGEIPNHWDIYKVKNLIDRSLYYQVGDGDHGSIKPEMYQEYGIPYIRVQNLSWSGKLLLENVVFISEEIQSLNLKSKLLPNDILIAKTGATVGKLGLMTNDITEANTTSSVGKLTVDKDRFCPKYILYSFQADFFQKELWLKACEKSAQPGFNIDDFVLFKIASPQLSEQITIANYLDQKTTQIEHLIAKKEQFIQLLEEERVAVINQAVTKGLDPNVSMKDSGIEWLGEIPAHWEVKKLKYCIQIQSGKGISNENLNPQGEYAVWGGNGIMGYTDDFSSDGNDLIIGRVGALCGNVHLVQGKKWISDNALFARTNENENFIELFLKFLDLNRLANKNAQPLITGTMVKEQFISLPKYDEQEQIATYIENQHKRIDNLLNKSKQEIELLKEYKTALISEVVTGKVDVRNEKLN